MRIEQKFQVGAPPQVVFDFMTDPENLAKWQTSKTRVQPLTEGPPRQGFQIREWTRGPRGRELEEVVEFDEFVRPSHLHVHVVEGEYPIDGDWVLEETGEGTTVDFAAEGKLRGALRFAEPVVGRFMRRQFAEYHKNLRREVEALS